MLANRIRNRQDSTRYIDDFELTVMFLLNDDGFVDTVPSLNTFLVLCTRARSVRPHKPSLLLTILCVKCTDIS